MGVKASGGFNSLGSRGKMVWQVGGLNHCNITGHDSSIQTYSSTQITKTERVQAERFLYWDIPSLPPSRATNWIQVFIFIVFLCEQLHITGVHFSDSPSATWQARSVLSVSVPLQMQTENGATCHWWNCSLHSATCQKQSVTSSTAVTTKEIREENYYLLPSCLKQQVAENEILIIPSLA